MVKPNVLGSSARSRATSSSAEHRAGARIALTYFRASATRE
jgi:hypothetical protein